MRSNPSAVSRQPSAEVGRQPPVPSPQSLAPRAFTLVEMLVAMAITLVMMAAVVTLFANVSNSVRNRRATIEMSGALRHVRNTLQQDLQGATCPGVTWQRPDSNHGYIELIEGIQSDQNPTGYIRDLDGDGVLAPSESLLDPNLSTIPRHNIGADLDGNGKITAQELERHYKDPRSLVLGGLGDHDDVLMLTVRNEHEPFVGRSPTGVRQRDQANPFDVNEATAEWGYESIESPLAEVIWYSVENPSATENDAVGKFFGEPGVRTVYRRALLIAPWLNPYSRQDSNGQEIAFTHGGGRFTAEPGLLRMLPEGIGIEQAFAAIIAFQDRYDLSARLEWDHDIQRWKIIANTLADLTKRENRFGHFGFMTGHTRRDQQYPYPLMSTGRGYSGSSIPLDFVTDPEVGGGGVANWLANPGAGGAIASYTLSSPGNLGAFLPVRPFAYVKSAPGAGGTPATANAVLNDQGDLVDQGQVVRVTFGPAPLWGARRGQDVMMTNVLGFDLRVYDPGAPLYGRREDPSVATSPLTVLQPSDPGWKMAYTANLGSAALGFEFLGQGAYVDMGYGYGAAALPMVPVGKSWTMPWFAQPRSLIDINFDIRPDVDKHLSQLAPGYAVYDTWSFHYENNGVNEDGDSNVAGQPLVDEGVNGFDDPDPRGGGNLALIDHANDVAVLGPDDVGEYETTPPYDKPLRGMQVLIRTYEPDSRAIRQVRVNQHFLAE